jgi:hypothetical protein
MKTFGEKVTLVPYAASRMRLASPMSSSSGVLSRSASLWAELRGTEKEAVTRIPYGAFRRSN